MVHIETEHHVYKKTKADNSFKIKNKTAKGEICI